MSPCLCLSDRPLFNQFPVPAGNEHAVWLSPQMVCSVQYMERTASGAMRQPTFKGLRDDKAPEDCLAKNQI